MLASSEEREEAGSGEYQDRHFAKILGEGFSFSGHERDNVHLNRRGEGFLDISGLSGIDSETDGRGAVYADFDNDGDYDIFLTALQGKAHHLFRNLVGQDDGFLRVTLEGTQSGRNAYGAVVRVKTSQGVLTKIKAGGSGFVSQSDPRLIFGLGDDARVEWVEIVWPSGTRERLEDIPARTSITVREGEGSYDVIRERKFDLPDPVSGEEALETLLAIRPGDRFPDLPLLTVGGESTRLAAVRRTGRHTLVNLWATWCVPCRREMPELEALVPELERNGLDVIGLSLDMGKDRKKVPRTIRKLGVTYPIFLAEETVFSRLFTGEEILVPLNFVMDGDGVVVDVFKGWSEGARRRIESLLPASAAARAGP